MTLTQMKDTSSSLSVNENNLDALSTRMQTPTYDRSALGSGILHMSIGGFHRAHQAFYLDELLSLQPDNWMITGVGLLPQDETNCNNLKEQDSLYTVLQRSNTEDAARIIGSIKTVIHAPTEQAACIEKLCSPDIRIVSLTITEKGYMYNEKSELDLSHPIVQHDIANPRTPQSALGYLTLALKTRRDNGTPAFTIMSCDNLPGNGDLTKKILLSFIAECDADLCRWVEDNVSFPNAMVDRITPVTTDKIISTIAENYGVDDKWPVICEDYIQWVLEDKFVNGRPAFEDVGVQMVDDVEPYEKMKVRLLNGSHSALSYLSYLMGYRDVDLAMADPLIREFVKKYMDEDITDSVPDVPGIDLESYKDILIERFSNKAVRDQIQRLAEDGSQKIPNAIVPCAIHQIEQGGSIKHIALAIACWYKYLTGVDEELQPIEIKDPMADEICAIAKSTPNDPARFLQIERIFGKLSHDAAFINAVQSALNDINEDGVKVTLQRTLK